MPLALIVHGGAGAIAPERHQITRDGCAAAALAGWQILRSGGSALDAVTAAVVALEDNPAFNAGTGSVLTRDGIAELDAGVMDGATLAVGAVAGVHRIKNPILLARRMLDSPEVLLIGDGAEQFAANQGFHFCDPDDLITAAMRERWRASLTTGDNAGAPLSDPEGRHGTVGAVALDAAGHIVAAASTGGVMNKPAGRVGDTPIAGAGFYAEDGIGGVSCTGRGEEFIRLAIARRAVEMLGRGDGAQEVAGASVTLLGERVGGLGGLIVVDHAGRVGFARNTVAMPYAFMTGDMGTPESGV
jgi:L-asparaginase / beta-aspartyl-peptidase